MKLVQLFVLCNLEAHKGREFKAVVAPLIVDTVYWQYLDTVGGKDGEAGWTQHLVACQFCFVIRIFGLVVVPWS